MITTEDRATKKALTMLKSLGLQIAIELQQMERQHKDENWVNIRLRTKDAFELVNVIKEI